MDKSFVSHPGAGTVRSTDGSALLTVQGTNVGWKEQQFAQAVNQQAFFQNIIVPSGVSLTDNLTLRLIIRQVDSGVGNVIFEALSRVLDHTSPPVDRDQALTSLGISAPTAVPGVGLETVISFSISQAGFTAGDEFQMAIRRRGADAGDDFLGKVAIVRFDADFIVTDPASKWLDGVPPNSIYYGAGNVGIGTFSPQEALHVSGAIRIGTTAIAANGNIRYTGTDFEGYFGGSWHSFTVGGGVDSDWLVSGVNMSSLPIGQVAIGGAFGEKLNVAGAIRLNNASPSGTIDGTISYSTAGGGLDFWARKSGSWVSMTAAGGGADTDWDYTTNPPNLIQGTAATGNVSLGAGTAPVEKLDVNGAIRLRGAAASNVGTIQWNGSDFLGRTASGWISLTAGAGGGNTLGQAYNQGGSGSGRVITVVASAPVLINGTTPSGLRMDDGMYIEFGDPTVAGRLWYQAGSFRLDTPDLSGGINLYVNTGSTPAGSGSVYMTTGNAIAGNSGSVNLSTGSATGTKGTVNVLNSRLIMSAHATDIGLRIPTSSGAPSSPATTQDGDILVDTSGHVFYYRSGGVWRTPPGSAVSLDIAYNNGSIITVDTGAVTLNSSVITALDINQNVSGRGVRVTSATPGADGFYANVSTGDALNGTVTMGRAARLATSGGTGRTLPLTSVWYASGMYASNTGIRAIEVDCSAMTPNSATASGAIYLAGSASSNAFYAGMYADANWDYGWYSASHTWMAADRAIYFGGTDVVSNRMGGRIWLSTALSPDAFIFDTGDRTNMGDTDQILIETGDAADGNSGGITIQTGTTSLTRGNLIMSGGSCTLTASTGSIILSSPLTSGWSVTGPSQILTLGTTGLASTVLLRNNGARSGAVGTITVDTGSQTTLDTGHANLRTGNVTAGTTANSSGAITVESGSCYNGASGYVSIGTGDSDSTTVGTGNTLLFTGDQTYSTSTGNSGLVSIFSGLVYRGTSGGILMSTGNAIPVSGTGNTGGITLQTGGVSGTTGDGNSGSVLIQTGQVNDVGNSGNISLNVSGVLGTGTRGYVYASGREIYLDGGSIDSRITIGGTSSSFRIGHGSSLPSSGYDPGSLFVYLVGTPKLYINTGTLGTPVWTVVGTQA